MTAFEATSELPGPSKALRADLTELRSGLQSHMREEFRRYVSFPDLLVDRWTRAREYGFGAGSSCYDNVLVLGEVAIGEETWIGPNVVLDGSGGLSVGAYCSISAGAQIYSHSSVEWSTSLGEAPINRSGTRIGDGVYIGPGAIVEMGVTIGDRAIIGALTLVRYDVPPGAKCFGVPGRLVDPGLSE